MTTLPWVLTEAQFQRRVTDLAELRGWRWYHTHRSERSVPGFPDLTMVRGKRLVFAELKSERGKVTPAQQQWLEWLGKATEAYVWRPTDWSEIEQALR